MYELSFKTVELVCYQKLFKTQVAAKSNHSVWIKPKTVIKKIFHDVSMLNPLLNELKLITKSRGTKGYKSMSKERLVSDLSESKLVESKNSFDAERLQFLMS